MTSFLSMHTDDMIYLSDSRELILSDTSKVRSDELMQGAFCRLLLVQMTSTIEFLLEEWGDKSENVNFDFMKNGSCISNIDRVQLLIDELEKSGQDIEHNIVKDFMAGKILRNSIVHSNISASNKEFCVHRGFPETVSLLGEEDWNRFSEVYKKMTMYIWISIRDFGEWPLTNRNHVGFLTIVFFGIGTATYSLQ